MKTSLNQRMHLHGHPVLILLGIVLPLGLSACSDTMAISDSPASSAELQRQYEKTLTKAEQKAVISDLQSAAVKKQGEAETGTKGTESRGIMN